MNRTATKTAPTTSVSAESIDALVGSIATMIADRINQQIVRPKPVRQIAGAGSPFMTIDEAADYLRCKPQRIYDLVYSGRLGRHKDSGRVLIRRSELELYVTGVEQTRQGARRTIGATY